MSHLISIIGAGPGDPGLLTVKASERLQEADAILYDALLGEEILVNTKKSATKTYVGKLYKDGQKQEQRQTEIHRMILELAQQNKKVVRLKAGDPMVFGRGAEEIRFCEEHHLNYEIIPGVTAGLAAASLFGIPVTERGKNSLSLLYTGHSHDGTFKDIEIVSQVLKTGSPVILYMGLANLPNLSEKLIGMGVNKKIPVHILSKISQPGQATFETLLGSTSTCLEENQPAMPAIIIIGEHAERIKKSEI
ncbi:MAG: uroporphyrinogen-III C-methyltransferase [Chlorobi bacterium]|nr:uroporphyrinogen-III C-methyltransferase [Chlorobiota bacterium]